MTAEQPWEIKPLNPSGMFLESLGTVYLYHQSWSVITKLENPKWTRALEFVKKCENIMIKICDIREHIIGDGECHHWEHDINLLIHQIYVRIDELEFFFGEEHNNRRKRGLINAGGWVLNKVFGTMDSEDAEKIYNKLGTLEKHDIEHFDLIKKQMTLIKSNFEQLTKPIQEMEKAEECPKN